MDILGMSEDNFLTYSFIGVIVGIVLVVLIAGIQRILANKGTKKSKNESLQEKIMQEEFSKKIDITESYSSEFDKKLDKLDLEEQFRGD